MRTLRMRTFAATVQQIDRRTLAGQFVPFGEAADVIDVEPDGISRYREGFDLGAFARQIEAARFRTIEFRDQHVGGWGKLGYVLAMREEPAGLMGEVRVDGEYQERVDTMLGDGIDSLSIGFVETARPRLDGGVRWRTRVHLDHVALVDKGAYPAAKVLEFRDGPDLITMEELEDREADEAAAAERRRQLAELDAILADAQAQTEAFARRLRVDAG